MAWERRFAALLRRPQAAFWIGSAFLLAGLLAAKLPVLAAQPAPPGADPGNWLAMAEAAAGQLTRLTDWAYPPLSYLLLRALLFLFSPLAAISIFGLAAWWAMGAALWYVLLRSLPRLPVLVKMGLAALFLFAGFNGEVFSWGGYPQLLGMGFLIVAVPALEGALLTGDRRSGAAAAAASVGVIFTHHLIAAALPLFWVIVFAWVTFQHRALFRVFWARFWRMGAATTAVSLLALPVYLHYLSLLAGVPTNSNGYSLSTLPQMLGYSFRGLTPLWLALFFLALAAPFLASRSRLSGSVLAFTWGTAVLIGLTWEVRFMHILFLGMVMGVGILFERAWVHPSYEARIGYGRRLGLAACLALSLAAVAGQGQSQFVQSVSYYQIVDRPVADGIGWLASHSAPGDRVVAYQAHLNHLNWWIEALARRPSFSPTDPRWLSFSRERYYTSVAAEITNPGTAPAQVSALLSTNRVAWVFIDQRNQAGLLNRLLRSGALVSAYENPAVVILRVEKTGGGAAGSGM